MTMVTCWHCCRQVDNGVAFCQCLIEGQPAPLLIGRYSVRGFLGAGAFGTVYKCFDPVVRRTVAIKRLERRATSMLNEVRELNVPGRLAHDNIIQVFDVLEDEKSIVMEYAEGGSLRDRMTNDRKWVQLNFIRIMREVSEGLRAAHSARIYHLDIKPDNILLTSSGKVKLGDFGVCRLVESTEYADAAVGTLPYMSYEALSGTRYKSEADIHSLGCVMYEVCAGRLPWIAHGNILAWYAMKTNETPTRLSQVTQGVDDLLSQLVSRMLARDETRITNIDSVIQQLSYLDPHEKRDVSTIDDLQMRLGAIYGFANAQRTPLYLLSQYLISIRSLSVALKTQDSAAAYHLFPKAFAWLCAATTAVNLRLGQVIWLKYDGRCPYCREIQCSCHTAWHRDQAAQNQILLERLAGRQPNQADPPQSFYSYRALFERIYGEINSTQDLQSIIAHNYSEVAEAMDAVLHLLPNDDSNSVLAMQLEFSDLAAWFFAILNKFEPEYDLPSALRNLFADGCYACKNIRCVCPEPMGVANWRKALEV